MWEWEYYAKLNINHQKVSIESHENNYRVKRVIRTIRYSILESKKINMDEKVMKRLNNTITVIMW